MSDPIRKRTGPSIQVILGLVAAVVAALFFAGADAVRRFQKAPRDFGSPAAEIFVRALAASDGPFDDGSGEVRTGYSAAWHRLSTRLHVTKPFDVFYDEWSRVLESHGAIVDDRITTTSGSRERPITCMLYLGRASQRHSELTVVKLELAVRREGDEAVVSDYVFSIAPNAEAR